MTEKKIELEEEMSIKGGLFGNDGMGVPLLDQIEEIPSCDKCPEDKQCIKTPDITLEEAEDEIESALEEGQDKAMLVAMGVAKKFTRLFACPKFVKIVQENPQLLEEIKEKVVEYG